MNIDITFVSVFACVKAHQSLPCVSKAVRTDILGSICLSVNEAGESLGTQTLRMKRDWFSQLSSMLMMRRPD